MRLTMRQTSHMAVASRAAARHGAGCFDRGSFLFGSVPFRTEAFDCLTVRTRLLARVKAAHDDAIALFVEQGESKRQVGAHIFESVETHETDARNLRACQTLQLSQSSVRARLMLDGALCASLQLGNAIFRPARYAPEQLIMSVGGAPQAA